MNLKESNLYRRFIETDKSAWFGVVFAAFMAGLMQGFIVLIINLTAGNLIRGGLTIRHLLLFILALSAYSLASKYSTSRTIGLTEKVIFSIYVDLADKVRRARTLTFERIGKANIYATLHTNTDIILETSKSLAGVGAAIVMILFCAAYIAYLSRSAIATIIIFYIFGIYVYTANLKRVQELLKETGLKEDRFKGLFRYFLEGFKELKVDRAKSLDLYENHVRTEAETARRARTQAEDRLAGNNVFIQSFYYCLVAATIFILPKVTGLDSLTIVKIAAVILFSYGSMTRIVLAIPLILKAEDAIAKLDRLEAELDRAREDIEPFADRFGRVRPTEMAISLKDAVFHYPGRENGSGFTLGPLSLEIPPGEIVFIIGGNGSGKTTLLKILAGLYSPESGRLEMAGREIDRTCLADYRNLFSVIFPDYYLFDRFYGRAKVAAEEVEALLDRMGLSDRVGWRKGRFDNLTLSAGQAKRLALVISRIEDRPILVIDEVAADLDPGFRKFFYEEYLQELKAAGRTIIAVSHDEQYFSTADRLVKLVNGRIISEQDGNAQKDEV